MTAGHPNAPPVGSVVGGYRLDRVIGRGAFGTVYAAVRSSDGVRAAVKVMTGRVLDLAEDAERFRREAELSRRLTHPNAVRVLDAGVAGNLYYTAFELLEGHSLQDEMARAGAMAPRRVAMLLVEVLAGLEAAHQAGIVHRDIKPANLFLALTPRGQEVKVLDFGVAKSTNPTTMARLTREGMTLGTPAYMAPELLAGEPATPATDLFAVGLVAAELTMGRFVYDPSSSAMAILTERLSGQRAPIPDEVVRGPLGPIVLRATAPNAAQRFQSASEMRTLLEALVASTPEEAATSGGKPRGAMGTTFPLAPAFAPTAAAQVPIRRPPGASDAPPPRPSLAATVTDDGSLAPRVVKRPALAATVNDDGSGAARAIAALTGGPPSAAAKRARHPIWLVLLFALALVVGAAAAAVVFGVSR